MKIISYFFIICIFFPYTKIGFAAPSDIQPYALIIGFLITVIYMFDSMIKGGVIEKELLTLLLLFVFSVITLFLFSDLNLNLVRGVGAYASFTFVITGALVAFKYINSNFFFRVVLISFALWLLVAIFQASFDKEFLTFLVNRSVITEDRGVISLSSEPSYYALISCFFSLFFYLEGSKKFTFISLLPIVFLAKSSVILMFLLASFCIALFLFGGAIIRAVLLVLVLISRCY
ncbi:hypothetical protein [Pseudoalteromonas gelatinilytica]